MSELGFAVDELIEADTDEEWARAYAGVLRAVKGDANEFRNTLIDYTDMDDAEIDAALKIAISEG